VAKSIGGLVPGGLARTAAMNAGLTPNTGVSSLIRAAIAMLVTGDIDKAVDYTQRRYNVKTVGTLSRDSNYHLSGYVNDFDEELAAFPNKSAAIRTGLAMLAGWTKDDAESQRFVAPQGRPKKVSVDA